MNVLDEEKERNSVVVIVIWGFVLRDHLSVNQHE